MRAVSHRVVPRAAKASDPAAHHDWATAIGKVRADPSRPRVVYQPIVDLRRGVVSGYEALARFDERPDLGPDAWFQAADRLGLGAALEAQVVHAVGAVRDSLPADCFVTVNVSPHLLAEPELLQAFADIGDLSRVVLELTEHVLVDDHAQLLALLNELRTAGAAVALDDAGSGYSGLQQLALVRPNIVKLDRAFVDYADRDEAKLAVAELLGAYAGRLDAVILGEGIERPEELAALIRLGVPLGQGWLFGRGQAAWAQLGAEQADLIRSLAEDTRHTERITSLIERTPVVRDDDLGAVRSLFLADRGLEVAAVVDRHNRPVCLLRRPTGEGRGGDEPRALPVSLRVSATAEVVDVATRAMTRPSETRFDPVVCGDAYGHYLGVVRPERLMLRLAEARSKYPDRAEYGK